MANEPRRLSPKEELALNIGAMSGAFAQQSERAFRKGQTFLKGAEGLRVAREKSEASKALDRIADNVLKLYDAYLGREDEIVTDRDTARVKEVTKKKAAEPIAKAREEAKVAIEEAVVEPKPVIEPEARPILAGVIARTALSPFETIGAEIGRDVAQYQQTVRQLGFEPDFLTKLLGTIYASRVLFGGKELEKLTTKTKGSLLDSFKILRQRRESEEQLRRLTNARR